MISKSSIDNKMIKILILPQLVSTSTLCKSWSDLTASILFSTGKAKMSRSLIDLLLEELVEKSGNKRWETLSGIRSTQNGDSLECIEEM